MALTDSQGRNIPFFLDYYRHFSIATADFSPLEDPSPVDIETGIFEEKGFIAKPNADGAFYAIQLFDYLANGKSLIGLVPQKFNGKDGQWIECRLVKVFASNDSTYATIATEINYGITI